MVRRDICANAWKDGARSAMAALSSDVVRESRCISDQIEAGDMWTVKDTLGHTERRQTVVGCDVCTRPPCVQRESGQQYHQVVPFVENN